MFTIKGTTWAILGLILVALAFAFIGGADAAVKGTAPWPAPVCGARR